MFLAFVRPLASLCEDTDVDVHSRVKILTSDVHSRVLRNTKCDLVIPRMRKAYGQNSFAFRGVDTWNKLHSDIKLAPSIQSFKAKLKAHNGKSSRKAGFNFPFFLFKFLLIGVLYRVSQKNYSTFD